jgi:hypothetical protein
MNKQEFLDLDSNTVLKIALIFEKNTSCKKDNFSYFLYKNISHALLLWLFQVKL